MLSLCSAGYQTQGFLLVMQAFYQPKPYSQLICAFLQQGSLPALSLYSAKFPTSQLTNSLPALSLLLIMVTMVLIWTLLVFTCFSLCMGLCGKVSANCDKKNPQQHQYSAGTVVFILLSHFSIYPSMVPQEKWGKPSWHMLRPFKPSAVKRKIRNSNRRVFF